MFIDPEKFNEEVLQSQFPVLVCFIATWCGPCRTMVPAIKEISEDNLVCKIDVEKNYELAKMYKISNVPTFIIFKNGSIKSRVIGVVSKNKLLKLLET